MPLPDFIASGEPLAGSTAELADILGAVQVDQETLEPIENLVKEVEVPESEPPIDITEDVPEQKDELETDLLEEVPEETRTEYEQDK